MHEALSPYTPTRAVSLNGTANPLRQIGAERKIYNCRGYARPFTLLRNCDVAARNIYCPRQQRLNGCSHSIAKYDHAHGGLDE
jgi:hypothetical protein